MTKPSSTRALTKKRGRGLTTKTGAWLAAFGLLLVTLGVSVVPRHAQAQCAQVTPRGSDLSDPMERYRLRDPMERHRLRLLLDHLDQDLPSSQVRTRRLEHAGWMLAGFSTLIGIGGLAVAAAADNAGVGSLDTVVGGVLVAMVSTIPLLVGVVIGSIGTVRRRRAQRRGEWVLGLGATGVDLRLRF